MILTFAREGESEVRDKAYRARTLLYYELVRLGVNPRKACEIAVARIDEWGNDTKCDVMRRSDAHE